LNTAAVSALLSGFVGVVAFLLCFLFRIQAKHLEDKYVNRAFPIDYSCGKTFKLISIYEKPRKLMHSFGWTLLVWIAALVSPLFLMYISFSILPSVGAISFLILITGLNLLVTREGFEAYDLSREIIAQQVATLGVGDREAVKKIAGALRKSSTYYLLVGTACASMVPLFFFLFVS
jgi:hypothetical protein